MSKLKIIVLQGPPRSGKSTWAREFVHGKKDWVIVSRDAFRDGRGDYNIPKQESYISMLELAGINSALDSGLNVVIDATNLNKKTINRWNNLASEKNVDIEYKEFYVPFLEAVERDRKCGEAGGRSIGKKEIKKFYHLYFPDRLEAEQTKTVNHYRIPIDKTKCPAIMCDIDGTLAWMQHRSPYSTQVKGDLPDERLAQLLSNYMQCGGEVIFVSGREGTQQCYEDTLQWLEEHLTGWEKHKMDSANQRKFSLHMRQEKDYRADEIVKREIYEREIMPWYDIICVFDDRQKVVNMWREIGLLCCQVAEGDF